MSMEERTLVLRGIDGDRLSNELLMELFANFGPLVRVVLRKTFAFIEYTSKESVAYAWAMADGIYLHDRLIHVHPKLENDPEYRIYRDRLRNFEHEIESDRSYIDTWLDEKQTKEKNKIVKLYKSNSSFASSLQRRFRTYRRHYTTRSNYNSILGRDLLCSDSDFRHSSARNKELRSSKAKRHPMESHYSVDDHRRTANFHRDKLSTHDRKNYSHHRHHYRQNIDYRNDHSSRHRDHHR